MNRDRALPAAAFDRYYHPYQWWITTPQPGELEYLNPQRERQRRALAAITPEEIAYWEAP